MKKKTLLKLRVYHGDTDAVGVVYHANYLRFFEQARVEALREAGLELNDLLKNHDTLFAVRSLEMSFLQPARLDQLLYVVTEITEVKHASILYNQEIHLDAEDGPLLCQAKLCLACLNTELRPRGLPQLLLQNIREIQCDNRFVLN